MDKSRNLLLGLLAETMVHVGSGRSLGVVDLPVTREPATDFPYIPGSSLKGALRELARRQGLREEEQVSLFGEAARAGGVQFSDALVLLLPVRSLSGAYKWVSCPLILERFRRMMAKIVLGGEISSSVVPAVKSGEAWVEKAGGQQELFLEERDFRLREDSSQLPSWIEAFGRLIPHEETRKRLGKYLALLSDDDFVWFARYGLGILARNKLDEHTKTSGNLWYEEALPPDTLMCALVRCRDKRSLDQLKEVLEGSGNLLQVGGNETVGQGWVSVKVVVEERNG